MGDGCAPFSPVVSAIHNAAPPVLRTPQLKTTTRQLNRRERPMCRSARRRTELLPIIQKTPPVCHSDRSASGVEESTTWQKVPTQGKICHSGRFLDSLRSLGMTYRGWFRLVCTGCICHAAERLMCRSARERTELLPIKTRNVPRCVIPTGAQAEWRNPPRSRNVPTQGKICNLGRFLDSVSLRSE